jgi:hypothetical protein
MHSPFADVLPRIIKFSFLQLHIAVASCSFCTKRIHHQLSKIVLEKCWIPLHPQIQTSLDEGVHIAFGILWLLAIPQNTRYIISSLTGCMPYSLPGGTDVPHTSSYIYTVLFLSYSFLIPFQETSPETESQFLFQFLLLLI